MATHSSNLAWEIPWAEEPGGLQSMVSQIQTEQTRTTCYTNPTLGFTLREMKLPSLRDLCTPFL